MSSGTIDFTQEPRKVFLSFLIDRLKVANWFIFVMTIPNDMAGLNVLDGIISSLNEDSQKALKDDWDKIRAASKVGGAKVDARAMYANVSKFLAKTYLEECQFGIIPTSALKGDSKAPDKKIARREKATL